MRGWQLLERVRARRRLRRRLDVRGWGRASAARTDRARFLLRAAIELGRAAVVLYQL
jgi:hypothetical protein